jgi:uncharacterized protein (DUF2147 family)
MRAIGFAAMVTLAVTMSAMTASARADGATGTWRMTNGKVTVRVSQCGAGLCANVVALKKPYYDDGSPKIDKYNPNKALRSRKVIGLSLLKSMKPTGDNQWAGEIYNPDDGRTYSATMTLEGNHFKLRGCVVGFLCKTQNFVRVN